MTAPVRNDRSYLAYQLRRAARFAAVLGLVVLAGRAALYHWTDQRLRTVVAALDAEEGAWRLEDLQRQRAVVPDADNAALVVQAAARLLAPLPATVQGSQRGAARNRMDEGKVFAAVPPQQPLHDAQAEYLRTALKRAGKAVALARTLPEYRQGRFEIKHGSNSSEPTAEQLGIRKVVLLLREAALLAIHENETGAALCDCRAVLAAGRALGDEPAPLYQVQRLECWDEALALLERALAQGRPVDADLRAVQQLLETEAAEPLVPRVLRGERALCHFRFSALEAGELTLFTSARGDDPPLAPALDWLAGQIVRFPHPGVLEYLSRRLAVAQLPPAAQPAALAQLGQDSHAEPTFGTLLGESRSRRLTLYFQHGQVRLHCAAAAAAAARYRERHGRWPESLAALVPEYLAQVPSDPFAEAPLIYRRLADGMVIYSVGRDGRDSGGKINAPPESLDGDIGFRLWEAEGR
jgi:hypothetical protein